jgi:hypothetical protein
MQESNIHQDRGKKEKRGDLQLGGVIVWNKICEFLEFKDREMRHNRKSNGKAYWGCQGL